MLGVPNEMGSVGPSASERGLQVHCELDTTRLVEEVLPVVAVRQWVLSFSLEIRYRLAWDGELVSTVLSIFLRVVQGWYRRQARASGHAGGRSGFVTFVQRFGGSISLNIPLAGDPAPSDLTGDGCAPPCPVANR